MLSVIDHPSLCILSSEALGTPLEEEELNAAMKILDTDESGVIEFDEFVDWWVNKVIKLISLSYL